MFDGLQGTDSLVRADDAAVVAAIAGWARAEAAASARRLAAIAELVRRRALGRQAEVLGPAYLASDIAHLTVGIDRIAAAEPARMDGATYRLVAADSRSPRNGRFIEIVGTYQPRLEPSGLVVDNEKAVKWLKNGAQPTETVERLLKISGAWGEFKGEAPAAPAPAAES